MAYDPDEDYEKEQRIQNYRQMQKDLVELQQRDFVRWRDATIQDELRKAAEELGLTQEDLGRHMADPSYERDIRKATRKLVEKASQRVGGKAKAASTRRESVERKGRPDMEALKARGRREQLSDDELASLLPRLIR